MSEELASFPPRRQSFVSFFVTNFVLVSVAIEQLTVSCRRRKTKSEKLANPLLRTSIPKCPSSSLEPLPHPLSSAALSFGTLSASLTALPQLPDQAAVQAVLAGVGPAPHGPRLSRPRLGVGSGAGVVGLPVVGHGSHAGRPRGHGRILRRHLV